MLLPWRPSLWNMNLWKTISKLLKPPNLEPNLVLHGVYSRHCCLKMSVLKMVWTPSCPSSSRFTSEFIYIDSSLECVLYPCVLVALWQLWMVPFVHLSEALKFCPILNSNSPHHGFWRTVFTWSQCMQRFLVLCHPHQTGPLHRAGWRDLD